MIFAGDGYIGCFKASMLYDYGFDEQGLALVTPEKCIAKCKTNMFSYAALHKGRKYVISLCIIHRGLLQFSALKPKSKK